MFVVIKRFSRLGTACKINKYIIFLLFFLDRIIDCQRLLTCWNILLRMKRRTIDASKLRRPTKRSRITDSVNGRCVLKFASSLFNHLASKFFNFPSSKCNNIDVWDDWNDPQISEKFYVFFIL